MQRKTTSSIIHGLHHHSGRLQMRLERYARRLSELYLKTETDAFLRVVEDGYRYGIKGVYIALASCI